MASKTVVAALAGLAIVTFVGAAEAQRPRGGGAQVTACSRYGNGCLTVPVRQGRFDAEYRLRNGTWMPCKQSCKDAIREDVIDYWETLNERAGSSRR